MKVAPGLNRPLSFSVEASARFPFNIDSDLRDFSINLLLKEPLPCFSSTTTSIVHSLYVVCFASTVGTVSKETEAAFNALHIFIYIFKNCNMFGNNKSKRLIRGICIYRLSLLHRKWITS